jgi:flagellar biosynthesis/type III secretory pathway M-ring protein FliF/YscJ
MPAPKKQSLHRHQDAQEVKVLREKVTELASQNPEKAALILASWLHNPAQSKKKTKRS